ncbi:hypothetical protein [uncultured Dialister sp.]|nr:hypothetical protein [uncultured Dialister sp.]
MNLYTDDKYMIRMIDHPAFSSGRAAGQGLSRAAWKAVKGHI